MFSLCLQYFLYLSMSRRMCRGNIRQTFYIFINIFGEVPERCIHWWLLFSRTITTTMLFYIIEICTFLLEGKALKLFIILQEYNFSRRNLYANSVAYVHLRHSPNHRRISEFYDAPWKSLKEAYCQWEWAIKNIWNNMLYSPRQRLGTNSSRMHNKMSEYYLDIITLLSTMSTATNISMMYTYIQK